MNRGSDLGAASPYSCRLGFIHLITSSIIFFCRGLFAIFIQARNSPQTNERTEGGKVRRIGRNDPDIVVVSRFESSDLYRSILEAKVSNCSTDKYNALSTTKDVIAIPLMPLTCMVFLNEVAWLSAGFQYSNTDSEVMPARHTSGIGGMSRPKRSTSSSTGF